MTRIKKIVDVFIVNEAKTKNRVRDIIKNIKGNCTEDVYLLILNFLLASIFSTKNSNQRGVIQLLSCKPVSDADSATLEQIPQPVLRLIFQILFEDENALKAIEPNLRITVDDKQKLVKWRNEVIEQELRRLAPVENKHIFSTCCKLVAGCVLIMSSAICFRILNQMGEQRALCL